MKINKKVNCSRIAAGYLFLGTLVAFIGQGAGLCLASIASVNSFDGLKYIIENNSSPTINIKANYITFGRKLSVIDRNLTISGEIGGSILNGDYFHRMLAFSPNLNNITINNIHFQNGLDEENGIVDFINGGGAINIKEGTAVTLNNISFSSNTALTYGGAIYSDGNVQNKNTLMFYSGTIFTDNKSICGYGGAVYALYSNLAFSGWTRFEK
ncbi:MAG: hypothetical protein LBP39_03350 [Rickettsiales bacterium]|nr:hypothetical protein [Rickettsiales bacterium]